MTAHAARNLATAIGRIFNLYHSADLDGKCCGALVEQEACSRNTPCVMLPINYGENILTAVLAHKPNARHDVLFISDFSPDKVAAFEALLSVFKHVTWIDHHKSAIEKYAEACGKLGVEIILDHRKAACELMAAHLAPRPTDKNPKAVTLLGVYDSWRSNDPLWLSEVLPFQYACRVYDTDPRTENGKDFWNLVLSPNLQSTWIDDMILEGSAILRYVTMDNATRARLLAFHKPWEGYDCVFLNRQPANSQMFLGVEGNAKVMVAFGLFPIGNALKYRVSLYTTDPTIDVSKIATRHNGGGHKGAAGFVCETLPFL